MIRKAKKFGKANVEEIVLFIKDEVSKHGSLGVDAIKAKFVPSRKTLELVNKFLATKTNITVTHGIDQRKTLYVLDKTNKNTNSGAYLAHKKPQSQQQGQCSQKILNVHDLLYSFKDTNEKKRTSARQSAFNSYLDNLIESFNPAFLCGDQIRPNLLQLFKTSIRSKFHESILPKGRSGSFPVYEIPERSQQANGACHLDYSDLSGPNRDFLFFKAFYTVLSSKGHDDSGKHKWNQFDFLLRFSTDWECNGRLPTSHYLHLHKARITADCFGARYESFVEAACDFFQGKCAAIANESERKSFKQTADSHHGNFPALKRLYGPKWRQVFADYQNYYHGHLDILTLIRRTDLYRYDHTNSESVEYQRRALAALEIEASHSSNPEKALCDLIEFRLRSCQISVDYVCRLRLEIAKRMVEAKQQETPIPKIKMSNFAKDKKRKAA